MRRDEVTDLYIVERMIIDNYVCRPAAHHDVDDASCQCDMSDSLTQAHLQNLQIWCEKNDD